MPAPNTAKIIKAEPAVSALQENRKPPQPSVSQLRLPAANRPDQISLVEELKSKKLSPTKAIVWGLKMILSGHSGSLESDAESIKSKPLVIMFGALKILNSAATAIFAYASTQLVAQLSGSGTVTPGAAGLAIGGLLTSLCSSVCIDGLTSKLYRSVPRQATNIISHTNGLKSRSTLSKQEYLDIVTTLKNEVSSGYMLIDGASSLVASGLIFMSATAKLTATNPYYALPIVAVAVAYATQILNKLKRDEDLKISSANKTRHALLLSYYLSIPRIIAAQRGIRLVKSITNFYNRQLQSTDRKFFKNENKTVRRVVAVTAFSVAAISSVAAFAIHAKQTGSLSMGTLASVLSLLGIVGQSLLSCNASAARVFMSADAMARLEALGRIGELRRTPGTLYQRIDRKGKIEFSFKLPTRTSPNPDSSSQHANFHSAFQDQSIAYLIGAQDSGRSKVMKSLAYADSEAPFRINGAKTNRIDPDDFDSVVGYLPSERPPINGITVRSLLFGDDCSLDDARISAKIQSISKYIDLDFLKTLEQWDLSKLDAIIGGEFQQINLNESRRERLILAGMLLREPRLLLLEDPFKSLDNPRRIELESNLEKWAAHYSAKIILTTNQSRLKPNAPVLLVNAGSIVTCGIHSEMMKNDANYAELFPDN